jgi:hypothetical protein
VGAEGDVVTAGKVRVSRRVVGFAAGALILAFLVWGVVRGWDTVRAFDWNLTPGWLVVGLLSLAVFYLASALGYAEIIARLHPAGPPRPVVADIWARSLLGRYVPGNVLMVAGRVVLGAEAGVPRRTSLAATVYEQVLALAVAAAGGVIAVAVHGEIGGGAPVWLVALVPLLLVPLHPRVFRPLTAWALGRAKREALAEVLETRAVAGLVAWYAVTAVLLAVGIWALVRSAAGPAAGGPVLVGGGFLLAFTVSMLAFIFPSGLGVREGAFALVLAERLPDEVAIAIAVGVRLALTAVELSFIGSAALAARGARRAEPA